MRAIGLLPIVFFLLLGFVFGKLDSWVGYAPLRKALRSQKKANKKLNKEQLKLTKAVEGFQNNISTLKEQQVSLPKPSFKEKIKAMFSKKSKEED